MQIINWIKFVWALVGLYPEAKKLWDEVHTQFVATKEAPKPTVEDFKKVVKDSFKEALTPISEVGSGLNSDGSSK